MSVVGGQPKENKNTKLPVIKQQNTSNVFFLSCLDFCNPWLLLVSIYFVVYLKPLISFTALTVVSMLFDSKNSVTMFS